MAVQHHSAGLQPATKVQNFGAVPRSKNRQIQSSAETQGLHLNVYGYRVAVSCNEPLPTHPLFRSGFEATSLFCCVCSVILYALLYFSCRFDMAYIDSDGSKKQPIMIHRAIFGSLERFFGILVENYAGKIINTISSTVLQWLAGLTAVRGGGRGMVWRR